jgi:hypothetical protein
VYRTPGGSGTEHASRWSTRVADRPTWTVEADGKEMGERLGGSWRLTAGSHRRAPPGEGVGDRQQGAAAVPPRPDPTDGDREDAGRKMGKAGREWAPEIREHRSATGRRIQKTQAAARQRARPGFGPVREDQEQRLPLVTFFPSTRS